MPQAARIRADYMTVEQTAEWIRSLGRYYNWSLADFYAETFAENDILGHHLQMLTFETLQVDLEIEDADHRQKIMMAIRYLFPSMTITEDSDLMEVEVCKSRSPMLHSSRIASPPWVNMMNILPCSDNEEMRD